MPRLSRFSPGRLDVSVVGDPGSSRRSPLRTSNELDEAARSNRGFVSGAMRIVKWKVALTVLALSFLIAVPVVASDTMTLNITGEGRSVSVGQASLESVGYSHDDQFTSGTISLIVDDSSASNDGWNVTVSAGDFVDGDKSIPGANLMLTGANEPTHNAGQEIDSAGGPKVPGSGAQGTLDTPRKVLQADAGFGKGTYSQLLNVELTVPGQVPSGSYVSNLTINITAGP